MVDNFSKIVLNNKGKISPLIIEDSSINGTGLCNVSIFIDNNGEILTNIRHVHYHLYHSEFNQKFYNKWGCLSYLNPEDEIALITGNWLCKLNPNTLLVDDYKKIDTSKHDIKPNWEFHGLEDARVFRWDDILYVCGVRRDVYNNGQGRMELCKIDKYKEITRDRIIPPKDTYLEKNWMPILDLPYHFVKWTSPLEIVKVLPDKKSKTKVKYGYTNNIESETIFKKDYQLSLPRDLRGSSQVVRIGDYRMCITHEVDFFYNPGKYKDAHYYHRFIIWDMDWNLVRLSKPFKFMNTRIEFCCGLAVQDRDLLVTFGYQDNTSYILKFDFEVLNQLSWEDESITK